MPEVRIPDEVPQELVAADKMVERLRKMLSSEPLPVDLRERIEADCRRVFERVFKPGGQNFLCPVEMEPAVKGLQAELQRAFNLLLHEITRLRVDMHMLRYRTVKE